MLRCGVGAKTIILPPSARAPPQSRACAAPGRGRRHRNPPGSGKKPPDGARGDGDALAGVLSKGVLLRSGAALFALGFVDAGYSGDWSRIGAISKDTEELLKLGAYIVVPLCLALVFSSVSDSSSES